MDWVDLADILRVFFEMSFSGLSPEDVWVSEFVDRCESDLKIQLGDQNLDLIEILTDAFEGRRAADETTVAEFIGKLEDLEAIAEEEEKVEASRQEHEQPWAEVENGLSEIIGKACRIGDPIDVIEAEIRATVDHYIDDYLKKPPTVLIFGNDLGTLKLWHLFRIRSQQSLMRLVSWCASHTENVDTVPKEDLQKHRDAIAKRIDEIEKEDEVQE